MDLGSNTLYHLPYTLNYIDALEAYMKQYNPSR